jgi:SAM-dependent methyltransferase
MEWYRFGWWFLSQRHAEVLRPGNRVLHVAAESEIRRRFEAIDGLTYAALDLDLRRASLVADLLRLPFVDGAIDLIYCSHVLEHVDDDRAALTEMRRVISADGAALLQVPITADETWGDPSITDPAERTRLFGQFNHVRRYGPDFVDIVRSCGWKVDQVRVSDLDAATVRKHGLPTHEQSRAAADVFWCTPA